WCLPVASSFRRQDILDNRDPHYIGHLSLGMSPKLAQRIRDADLIIAIGTRLGDVNTDAYSLLTPGCRAQNRIHIHPAVNELGRVYQARRAVHRDSETAALSLVQATPPRQPPWQAWTQAARGDHEAFCVAPALSAGHSGVDMTS